MIASRVQLELAAEQTIGAATAALLWAGQDNYSVLEHVAGASVGRMVESRCAYSLFQMIRREVPAEKWPAVDEDLNRWVAAGSFEVAALPEPAVPTWADAMRAALREAFGDQGPWDTSDPRNSGPDDAAMWRRALHGSVRGHALSVCSWWGEDPLPLMQIETLSRIVSLQTCPVPIDQFQSSRP
jgi:hypothetical protein